VHDVHDTDAWIHDAAKNDVFSHREAAITTPQFVAAAAGSGIVPQQLEVVRQQIDESVGGPLIVLGNMLSDLEHLSSGATRKPVGHHRGCWRPPCARASRFRSSASLGKVESV
jgi:hypothetical protein